ncbi:MAG: anthranilate phosphoribosyltransferase [Sarcina sp.]
MNITEGIKKVVERKSLTAEEMQECINEIINGKTTSSQIGSFLTGMTMKGEVTEEVIGGVKALRENMTKIAFKGEKVIDVCGTGGDGFNTFNVSTVVSFIIAALGATVAKHGNRSISSECGSFDVIEELGIDINMTSEEIEFCLEEFNLAFLFAPRFHNAMKNIANERKEIGIRTLFNQVGPLINPVNLTHQLMGVSRSENQRIACEVMRDIGIKRGIVVCAENGLDEVSLSCKTKICELKNNEILEYEISPEDFGIDCYEMSEVIGGDRKTNAKIIQDILSGEKGAKREMVILNAALAIYLLGFSESIKNGISMAKECIDTGKAYRKLEQIRAFSKGVNYDIR